MSDEKPVSIDLLRSLSPLEGMKKDNIAALARKAPTPTLKSIYEHFHAEEQKHANAELALMRRARCGAPPTCRRKGCRRREIDTRWRPTFEDRTVDFEPVRDLAAQESWPRAGVSAKTRA